MRTAVGILLRARRGVRCGRGLLAHALGDVVADPGRLGLVDLHGKAQQCAAARGSFARADLRRHRAGLLVHVGDGQAARVRALRSLSPAQGTTIE